MADPNQPSEPNPTPPAPAPSSVAAGPPPAVPTPPTSVAPGAPPTPAKPQAAKPQANEPTRRNFLVNATMVTYGIFFGSWFATAWTTFTLSMIGMTLGTV